MKSGKPLRLTTSARTDGENAPPESTSSSRAKKRSIIDEIKEKRKTVTMYEPNIDALAEAYWAKFDPAFQKDD